MREPEGFREYVANRRDTLVRTGVVLTGDRETAEDLVQNTLMRIWSKWERVGAAQDVNAYVHRVLINTYLSSVRHRRWREVLGDGSSPADPDAAAADEFGRSEARLDLIPVLRTLPARQRAVIAMRYYLDMSEEQTAAALGCSAGTVKSQAHKAMRKLEAVLEQRPMRPEPPVNERPA